jgi:RNA-binding protein
MTDTERRRRIHDLDATVRVGKGGVESVAAELAEQLDVNELVKVKFLRSALGGTTIEDAAAELAAAAGCDVVETRGHTAVYEA